MQSVWLAVFDTDEENGAMKVVSEVINGTICSQKNPAKI